MKKKRKIIILCGVFTELIFPLSFILWPAFILGQKTQIRGFVDALTTLQDKKVTFGFGEQDLFISSELSDRFFS
jgi:hypothetical protein